MYHLFFLIRLFNHSHRGQFIYLWIKFLRFFPFKKNIKIHFENHEFMKKFDVQFHSNPSKSDALSILLSGELTLETVGLLKENILKKIPDKQEIEILISDVEEIDLPFFQFLISIHKTLKKQQKSIAIAMNLSEEDEELFRKSGLDYNFS